MPRCLEWRDGKGGKKAEPLVTYRLKISMTDFDVMQEFVKIVGYGNLNGPYQPKIKNNKPYWQWECAKKCEVFRILNLLLPYLGSRRRSKAMEVLANLKARS